MVDFFFECFSAKIEIINWFASSFFLGTNPDHARNSLTNCGIRQPEYGDRKIHYLNTRKRGINTLINIMSRFGKENETDSSITHNERLEFLGDAVVEFLTSIHLFFMFPDLEEGGLATYRAAIVQNQHLAVLAKVNGSNGNAKKYEINVRFFFFFSIIE